MTTQEGPSAAILALAKALGIPRGASFSYDNDPGPRALDVLNGYWVVDSVDAAKGGNFKQYAIGWCEQIKAGILAAEYASAQDSKDYVVLDNKGHVVA